MSNYNLSQKLNHVNEHNYDDDISATLPKGKFMAVVGNTIAEDSDQRIITVRIFDLEQGPGGESNANSGLYVRRDRENSVKAVLLSGDGAEVDSNVQNYL